MPQRNLQIKCSNRQKQKIREAARLPCFFELLVLTLARSLRLLLTLYAGLLIMLSLAELGEHTGSRALAFKAAKSAVKRLILFYSDFCH